MAENPPRYRPSKKDEESIQRVRKRVDEAKRWHNTFARKVERRYGAWRGMLAESDDARPTGWRSNQHPPYLISIVEGMLSSLEEENPAWEVAPRAIPGLTLEEVLQASDGAELASYLLSHQMRIDDFGAKSGPLAHQDLIAGLTVGKIYWLQKKVKHLSLERGQELVYDEAGGTLDMANTLDEYEQELTTRDDPTLEIRDVRDFMYPESAVSVDSAPWLIDRTYVTYSTLKTLERLGVYKNVKYVKETRYDETPRSSDPVMEREQRLRSVDRTRGLVEIIELWTNDQVITVANQSVLLRDAPNPFSHGRKPFVVCSAIPDLFQIPGVSVIEGLASMQEMLWTLTNIRLDATRISSNVITMIRGDVDDPEQYEWAPEAQWIVPDPNAVQVMDMSAVAAAAASTLQAEGLLRGDIQNVMGGLPFTGSAQSQSLPTDTATGVSIVTNIAQAILGRRKAQYQRMFGKVGQMFLELDQQFMKDDRLIEILGESGARRYLEVAPEDIQGIYDVSLRVQGESLMRQEKRSENQALVTMAMQAAPIMAQAGAPLDLRRFWERLLEAYDVTDKEAFFKAQQQQGALAAPPGTPQTAQGIQEQLTPSAPGEPGTTNPELAAGPQSPSNAVSISPGTAMQRSLSAVGAGRSA